MDYYSTLGVPRNASQEDIKKAYKKASMQHHPDRTGGDDVQFKKINEAYQTLGNAQKRAEYDNPQVRMNSSMFEQNYGNFNDIFGNMFGQQSRRQSANTDVKIRVKIEFHEILTGKSINVTYRLRNGQTENVNLDIPAGAKDGDTIKFRHLGDNSFPGLRGDLYVTVQINNKVGWQRSNNDLITRIFVNCLEMIVGGKAVVNTLHGNQLELSIPPGTKNGTTFSVNGYGIPDIRSGVRGKLLVTVEAEIPKSLSQDKIEKIKEILNATS